MSGCFCSSRPQAWYVSGGHRHLQLPPGAAAEARVGAMLREVSSWSGSGPESKTLGVYLSRVDGGP